MSRNFSLDWSTCRLVLCSLNARISRRRDEYPSSSGSHQLWISGRCHISAIFLRKVGGNMYLRGARSVLHKSEMRGLLQAHPFCSTVAIFLLHHIVFFSSFSRKTAAIPRLSWAPKMLPFGLAGHLSMASKILHWSSDRASISG